MYRIGIDLGGTNVAAGIIDEEYRLIATASTPTRSELGPEGIVGDMTTIINNMLTMGGLRREDCAGIGIGSPGNCDMEHGVVRNAHNLGWNGVPVCEMLQKSTLLPVRLANDADCAALGEVVAGAAKGGSGALLVTLGTGVGTGLVIDGKIYAGSRSLGGEFGHMKIMMDGEACTCGQKGCWEAYASATALIRQAKRAAEAHPESLLAKAEHIEGKTVFQALAQGDAVADTVVKQYAAYVGVGLVNLINGLFPEAVLLGGGVAGAGEALLGPVREYVAANFFVADPALVPPIRKAELGNDAGIIGAAALWS
ncbi:MAG: ROK family protein [Oscillospiraceae bacterium]|nr:ROK family protein [Oscillospiraceae bacterium]